MILLMTCIDVCEVSGMKILTCAGYATPNLFSQGMGKRPRRIE